MRRSVREVVFLPVCVSKARSVRVDTCHKDSSTHQNPIDERHIELTVIDSRCMDNLDLRAV